MSACHVEHAISFTNAPVGRDIPGGKWEPCPEVERAKAACKRARWPEQHRDDCAWCSLVGEERRLREALLND